MEERFKLFSEMDKFEIINICDGEKYGYLYNNDIIIDDEGSLKYLIVNSNKNKFSLFGGDNFIELPWECVNKIGKRTIIIDIDEVPFDTNNK